MFSSIQNVGGGSLGAHKTTFNSAYAGCDSIHTTRMEVSPGPHCKYTTDADVKIEVSTISGFTSSPRDRYAGKDSLLDVGQLTTRDWTSADSSRHCFAVSIYIN